MTNERGFAYLYSYDKEDRETSVTDPEKGTTSRTYTPTGYVGSITDAMDGVITYTYDNNENIIAVKDQEGYIVEYSYDKNNRPTTAKDANGNVTRFAYDGNGNLTKITDPRGNSKVAEFDPLDRVVKSTNEEGGVVELTYDAMDRLTKAVNEDGAVTEYTRDGKGRITAIKDAHGNYRYLEHDPMDRVTADTDENGVRRTYEYDKKGNLIKYTDGLGYSESYVYDGNDRLTTKTDKKGLIYTYTHDPLNRVTSETNPLGDVKYFGYDKNSRITSVTDRNSNKTSYKLDGNGNITESIDATGHSSLFEYDSMNRMTKAKLHRIDTVHKVDEIQETLYTYDYRGLVKTEVNAKGDGKAMVYDGNGNLTALTDEDGYVTKHSYSPVNLVSTTKYADGKTATFLYDGTGDLVEMTDWNGETTFKVDLLDRITGVNDHKGKTVNYKYDNVGNTDVIQYPDGTQADYWYDAENQMTEMVDFDRGMSKFKFDPNGNVIEKEYPNYETAYYFYDDWNQIVEMDEYVLGGSKLYKTTYSWDAEGNRLSEMQYNHGQSAMLAEDNSTYEIPDLTPIVPEKGNNGKGKQKNPAAQAIADLLTMPNPLANTQAGLFLKPNTAESNKAIIDGNGNGNGEVPPGQTEGEDGTITNPGGNTPPGLNKGDKPEKPDHPNKPPKPDNPGNEDGSDAKAQKGTHIYTYDKLNRVVTGDVAKVKTNYTYDTLGNLVLEKAKNNVIDYQYNNLNQLVRKAIKNDITTFSYDKRGNRLAETGKKASQSFVYDATNHLVKGTNWKGETSEYTYNALFVRVNQSQTNNGNKTYARDYVIDYTSYERNDLAVFSPGYMEQKHLYTAWGERTEQFTERGNWDRLLYVHEDVMGNTRYYTKDTGMTFAELQYDVWGAIASPNKLENNDNGNFVAANFTGHIYDTVLDIYHAEARFYDAKSRQWMSSDPIKDGLNWYQYVGANPTTYFDPDGLMEMTVTGEPGSEDTSTYYGDQVKETQKMLIELGYMSGEYVADKEGNLNYTSTVGGATIGAARLFDFNYNGNYNAAVGRDTIDDELYLQIANQYVNKTNRELSAKEREEMYQKYMEAVEHADNSYESATGKTAGAVNGYYKLFECSIGKKASLPELLKSLGVKLKTDYSSLDNVLRLDISAPIDRFLQETIQEVLPRRMSTQEEWSNKYNPFIYGNAALIDNPLSEYLDTTLWFLEMDGNNAPWDIKVAKNFKEAMDFENLHNTVDHVYNGQIVNTERIGNITFGYWAAGLGYSWNDVVFGGGMATIQSDLFKITDIANGYWGDEPKDVPFVEQGYNNFFTDYPQFNKR